MMREIATGTIDWEANLWRYFRPERFIQALETQSIYFASPNQFDDRFEGAVAVQTVDRSEDPRYGEMEPAERAFFQLKRLTKISCWHVAEYESDAMWKLYAEKNKGIAVCTTPSRMRAAFKPFRLRPDYGVEVIRGGPVNYVDLTAVRMRNKGMLERFFCKHRAFEWEREFRLAISLRSAEEFGVHVPSNGICVEVDFNLLAHRIILGSTASPDDREQIKRHVDRAGLADRLERSSLLGWPRYV